MAENNLRVQVLLSMQRALWEAVTPDLRGIALGVPDLGAGRAALSARFLYEGDIGELQRELISLTEACMIADFPQISSGFPIDFQAVTHADRQLLGGEEWVYLRREPNTPETSDGRGTS